MEANRTAKIRNVIIVGVAAFLVFLIIFFVRFLLDRDKTATVRILVAPTTAEVALVRMNVEVVEELHFGTDETVRVVPGEYVVKISQDGFETYNGILVATSGATAYLYQVLDPSDGESSFYDGSIVEGRRAQMVADLLAAHEQAAHEGADEIFKVTPYDSYENGFRVSAYVDAVDPNTETDGDGINVYIYLYTCAEEDIESLKAAAEKYLVDAGLTLINYNISYSHC